MRSSHMFHHSLATCSHWRPGTPSPTYTSSPTYTLPHLHPPPPTPSPAYTLPHLHPPYLHSLPHLYLLPPPYQSKESPLYVTKMCGLTSRMCSKNFLSTAASLGMFHTVNGPSYSGLGVYSKSSTSAPITSRLVSR